MTLRFLEMNGLEKTVETKGVDYFFWLSIGNRYRKILINRRKVMYVQPLGTLKHRGLNRTKNSELMMGTGNFSTFQNQKQIRCCILKAEWPHTHA